MWPCGIKSLELVTTGNLCEHIRGNTLISAHAGDGTAEFTGVVPPLIEKLGKQSAILAELAESGNVVGDLVDGTEEEMVPHVLADSFVVDADGDLLGVQIFLGADTGDHEELGRTKGTGGENDLAVGGDLDEVASCIGVFDAINSRSGVCRGGLGKEETSSEGTGDDLEVGTLRGNSEEAGGGRISGHVSGIDGER